ncbi:MAG: 4-hydroxy-tetrahydrodipicolinate reductase [Halobacteria archaeon]
MTVLPVAVAGARGRMGGALVEALAARRDMALCAAFDVVGHGLASGPVRVEAPSEAALRRSRARVLIDFTAPAGALASARMAARTGTALVVGTTGFTPAQAAALRRTVGRRVPAVVSSNFSAGVNAFWKLEELALDLLPGYDVEITEVHHKSKKDAPSGTAREMVRIAADRGRRAPTHSLRAGDVVGDHTLVLAGPGERLELTHRAHSRAAFAEGALRAARWVVGARPGIHAMGEVLGL